MYSLNSSRSITTGPRVGDWIVGFFMDGELGQMPVMMGVLAGLKV